MKTIQNFSTLPPQKLPHISASHHRNMMPRKYYLYSLPVIPLLPFSFLWDFLPVATKLLSSRSTMATALLNLRLILSQHLLWPISSIWPGWTISPPRHVFFTWVPGFCPTSLVASQSRLLGPLLPTVRAPQDSACTCSLLHQHPLSWWLHAASQLSGTSMSWWFLKLTSLPWTSVFNSTVVPTHLFHIATWMSKRNLRPDIPKKPQNPGLPHFR